MTSHLLPTYARVDLAFERGEGAWLIATNGERYLDFASGIAVNALGHAHPHLVAALTEQAEKLWHVSNLYRIPEGERLAERLCAASFADLVFFAQFRRRGDGMRDQDGAQISSRPTASPSATASSPSKAPSTAARWRRSRPAARQKYLDGFGPVVDGFDQVPFGDLEAVKRAIGPETAAHPDRADQGEGGVRVAPPQFLRALRAALRRARPAADLRRGADRHRPHRRAVRLSASSA